jgi:Ca2+-binding RTX toxin-like protein
MRSRAILLLVLTATTVIVASGVAWAASISCPNREGNLCVGTTDADIMTGRDRSDDIRARAGDDTVKARGGKDRIRGGPGGDQLFGASGSDDLSGGGDIDVLDGGTGNDALAGGDADDRYRYLQELWGHDTISDAPVSDPSPAIDNELFIGSPDTTQALTINLVSSNARSEVTSATSTIDWDGDSINVVSNFSRTDDTIDGNPGPNYIKSTGVAGISAGGTDIVSAGGGDDRIDVDDGALGDTVDCGGIVFPDDDIAFYDAGDAVSNCETRVQDGVVQP